MHSFGTQYFTFTDSRVRIIALVFCLLALGIQSAAAESAETDSSGVTLKLFGGLNFVPDTDFDGSGSALFETGEASLDPGFTSGLAVGYRFDQNFSAELEYAYRTNDIDELKGDSGSIIADGGDLASVAIMANAYYSFDYWDNWAPYVGLGFGILQEIDADVDFLATGTSEEVEDESIAWQVMAGAEVPLDDSWSVYSEARFFSAPGPELENDAGSYDLDYNNVSLIAGVGFRF